VTQKSSDIFLGKYSRGMHEENTIWNELESGLGSHHAQKKINNMRWSKSRSNTIIGMNMGCIRKTPSTKKIQHGIWDRAYSTGTSRSRKMRKQSSSKFTQTS
jgi:hypothetical protein